MKLLFPVSQIKSLKAYLRRAGSQETGGLLMGEQLAADEFRVAEFSFNRRSGSLASFTRDMRAHRRALEKFFRKTGRDFQRFNYLGEWHSHPHFPVIPSASDIAAMQAIVNDRAVGANFATLLIVQLRRDAALEIGPYLFVPGKRLPYPIECVVACEPSSGSDGLKAVFTDASNLVSAGFALLITTVVSNLLSADLKARLVFLRWKHALPGRRAFTVYAPRDPRVDMAALAQTYGPDLPTDAAEQNTLWYRIFQTVTDEPQILHTHRNFLLLRDYTAIAAICTLAYGVTAVFCIGSGRICSLYVLLLLVQLVVVRQSAFNSGVRLVMNSLAMACHKEAPLTRSNGSRFETEKSASRRKADSLHRCAN